MWNEDRGYFYGVLLGDGFYEQHPSNGSPYVMLKACDRDFVEYWSKVVSRIVGKEYSVHGHVGATDKHRAQWRCKVYYRPLVVEAFEVTRDKTVIPNGILDADASVKRALIQGLMDSEGFITFTLKPLGSTSLSLSFANASEWSRDLYRMFGELGITTSKMYIRQSKQLTVTGKQPKPVFYWCIHILDYVNAGLGFNIKRKADRLAWCSKILTDYTRNYPRYADYYTFAG